MEIEHANTKRSTRRSGRRVLWCQSLVMLLASIFFAYAFVSGYWNFHLPASASEIPDGQLAELVDEDAEYATELEPQDKDYSRFTHSNQFHSRLPCLLCHRRDDNSARMRYPGKINHLPCAGCHSLQFSDPSSPICTICHTNPQTGATKGFLRLRSFNARFNHAKHSRVNCATCHRPSRGGVARSIPSGSAAHTTCFQCHTNRASLAMTSCSVCHQPGRLVRTSETAVAFRRSFSHAKHSQRMNCSTCHVVRAGSARGRQVTSPAASMHFPPGNSPSCGACHNGERAFGANDFTNCRRCHTGQTFRF
jgi:c(7)-type cytochrome triheme protein